MLNFHYCYCATACFCYFSLVAIIDLLFYFLQSLIVDVLSCFLAKRTLEKLFFFSDTRCFIFCSNVWSLEQFACCQVSKIHKMVLYFLYFLDCLSFSFLVSIPCISLPMFYNVSLNVTVAS